MPLLRMTVAQFHARSCRVWKMTPPRPLNLCGVVKPPHSGLAHSPDAIADGEPRPHIKTSPRSSNFPKPQSKASNDQPRTRPLRHPSDGSGRHAQPPFRTRVTHKNTNNTLVVCSKPNQRVARRAFRRPTGLRFPPTVTRRPVEQRQATGGWPANDRAAPPPKRKPTDCTLAPVFSRLPYPRTARPRCERGGRQSPTKITETPHERPPYNFPPRVYLPAASCS